MPSAKFVGDEVHGELVEAAVAYHVVVPHGVERQAEAKHHVGAQLAAVLVEWAGWRSALGRRSVFWHVEAFVEMRTSRLYSTESSH